MSVSQEGLMSIQKLYVFSEIFTANILTGAKHHSAFLTNHLTDIDKTTQNYNQETTENLRNQRV